MEVHAQEEKLIWMTSTQRFKATFRDLATAMKLSYYAMKRGKLVNDLPVLGTGEISGFQY